MCPPYWNWVNWGFWSLAPQITYLWKLFPFFYVPHLYNWLLLTPRWWRILCFSQEAYIFGIIYRLFCQCIKKDAFHHFFLFKVSRLILFPALITSGKSRQIFFLHFINIFSSRHNHIKKNIQSCIVHFKIYTFWYLNYSYFQFWLQYQPSGGGGTRSPA